MPRARNGTSLLLLTLLAGAACGGGESGAAKSEPYHFERPDPGPPVRADEVSVATERFLEILTDTRYFALVDERSQGWPASDPEGRYAYGTWWSGVRLNRAGDRLTFDHPDDGSDNNGLRTAPLLEGACYAFALWGKPEHEALTRKLMRGFTSWILAMERGSTGDGPTLLTRAAYPEPITFTRDGLEIVLDYADQRPGLDNPATEYVHNPDNPHWGDLWIKNKRSKDDIGHMLRAIAQLSTCAPGFSAETRADHEVLLFHYRAWARQVEADGFKIATYDKSGAVWVPVESLAVYIQELGAECNAALALRLFGTGATTSPTGDAIDCGNGVTEADLLFANLNDHNRHIFLSHHQALAQIAIVGSEHALATKMLEGLTLRNDQTLDALEAGAPPTHHDDKDFAGFIVHAANAGVPLSAREVRYLHARIEAAHTGLMRPQHDTLLQAFLPGAPDGEYAYRPPSIGFNFREIGAILGLCASAHNNPSGQPAVDCDLIRAYTPL